MSESSVTRRDMLGGAALLALALGVPVAGVWLSDKDLAEIANERQRAMLKQVAQLVIPASDTPGAGDAGVGDFVILALAHGLDGTGEAVSAASSAWELREFKRNDGSLSFVGWLERKLDRAVGGDWLGKDRASQLAALEELDRQSSPPGPPPQDPSPWRKLKALILTGYYTSQIGGAQELRFEMVPGRYDPDLPLTRDYRAWSSDWIAVEFG